MYYLGIDTTNKYLIVSIFNDDQVLYFYQAESNRNVSELANVEIAEAFDSLDLSPSDLKAIVVTRGPGSFTGVRIGLTIGKVMATTLDIPLFSLSSLQYYAGLSTSNVILDARSKKVFLGRFDQGQEISEKHVLVSDLDSTSNYIGDLQVIDKELEYGDLSENFLLLKDKYKLESSLDAKPEYMKDSIWLLKI